MSYLQLGDNSRDVEVWQRFLAQIWMLDIDRVLIGTFDETTDAATREFQQQNGLDVSGVVDVLTREKADLRGLQVMHDLTFRGPTKTIFIVGVSMFIILILLTQCMVLPESPRNMQGTPLPLSPTMVPGARVPPPCPGWFC